MTDDFSCMREKSCEFSTRHFPYGQATHSLSASNGPTSLAVDNEPLCKPSVQVTASHVCDRDGCHNNRYGHLDRHVVRQTAVFLSLRNHVMTSLEGRQKRSGQDRSRTAA